MTSISSEPDWMTAKKGLILFLNNKVDEAEALFAQKPESFHIKAARCYIFFMNALMTFEDEKFQQASKILKDTEQECDNEIGWLRSLTNRFFGSKSSNDDYAKRLEQQIVLADIQVCTAMLIFLQQDVSSYVRSGWIMRKAWRIYQHTYHQILYLYRRTFGINPSGFNGDNNIKNDGIQHSYFKGLNWRSESCNDSLSAATTPAAVTSTRPSIRNSVSMIFSVNGVSKQETNFVEPAEVIRLMSAVSFGYGIFQLCVSLVPHSLLKLFHFLGFEGDRRAGLTALMYARLSDDMRAPLATLSLLCYHTVIRPFCFSFDGNIKSGINAAKQLINECQEENNYGALWLFFTGRTERLQSNFHVALNAYTEALKISSQREIQLLCLHEVAWCHATCLKNGDAYRCFAQLKNESRWCKTVYAYLAAVCAGADNQLTDVMKMYKEVVNMLANIQKFTQLDAFILRRVPKLVNQSEVTTEFLSSHYKMLVYEFLYLWNTMSTCTTEALLNIVSECTENENEEPMVGLSHFLTGAAYVYLGENASAVECFEECLKKRNSMENPDDQHVSSFALYELGLCLCKTNKIDEGKHMLMKAQTQHNNYDFESRLNIRIHFALKMYS